MNTKQKGNLLEDVVNQICSGIKKVKITKNANIMGQNSNTMREIDTLIEGNVGPFGIKIIVESKNYNTKVGIEKVEALNTKLQDIKGNLGVIVCPLGFTQPAINSARTYGIDLYEIVDSKLSNSNLFIPLRYIEPFIEKYSFEIHHRAQSDFSISSNPLEWLFHIDGEILTPEKFINKTWNERKIPKYKGEHTVNLNAVTLSDIQYPLRINYFELILRIIVDEKYFLKLLPASFMKNVNSDSHHFNLPVHIFSSEDDMIINGWKKYTNFEDMNKDADIENQPEQVRGIILRPDYDIIDSSNEGLH